MTRFKMTAVKAPEFALLDTGVPKGTVAFDTVVSFKPTGSPGTLCCVAGFRFHVDGNSVAVLAVECSFEIHPDDFALMCSDNMVTVPRHVLEFFAVHTIGTARGIMFCKTEGTNYNGLIITPVDATRLIGGDLVLRLDRWGDRREA